MRGDLGSEESRPVDIGGAGHSASSSVRGRPPGSSHPAIDTMRATSLKVLPGVTKFSSTAQGW